MLSKKQKKVPPKCKQKPKAKENHKTRQKGQDPKAITTLFEKVVNILCWPSSLIHCIIAALAVGLGFFFNGLGEMPLFWLKAIFGFTLYVVLVFSISYLKANHKALTIELTGDPNLVKCQIEYTKKTNSNCNFILCFMAGTYFVVISVVLGFVQKTPIGIYSLIALFFVVFCAFVVFQQYIHILFLLYKISRISPRNFYELLPERTKWFYLLEQVSHVCRNFFIILGSLFILLFVIFSPVNSIQILFQERISSNQYIPLLCTWIIILFAIVFMVPLSSYVRSRLLQKTYDNLTTKSIQTYNCLYESSQANNKLVYADIILRLNDRKYKLKDSYAWVFPVFVSIVNYASVVISAVADLSSLGLLS